MLSYRKKENEIIKISINDISCIILESYTITITKETLSLLSSNNIPVIICDEKHNPISILLPLYSHTQNSNVLQKQIKFINNEKILWNKILKIKLYNQFECLNINNKKNIQLNIYLNEYKDNYSKIEGQAAKYYFSSLFGNEFRRDRNLSGVNSLLNYGYTILRSFIIREICATGLNPMIGINHSNIYNPFPLADYIIEVFRQFVDYNVYILLNNGFYELTSYTKNELIKTLDFECIINDKHYILEDAIKIFVQNIKLIITQEKTKIEAPKICKVKE